MIVHSLKDSCQFWKVNETLTLCRRIQHRADVVTHLYSLSWSSPFCTKSEYSIASFRIMVDCELRMVTRWKCGPKLEDPMRLIHGRHSILFTRLDIDLIPLMINI